MIGSSEGSVSFLRANFVVAAPEAFACHFLPDCTQHCSNCLDRRAPAWAIILLEETDAVQVLVIFVLWGQQL